MTARTAVVTGAARGLGRGIAEELAAAGYRVVVADLLGELAEETAEKIRGGGEARGMALDVRDPAAVEALFEQVVAEDGGLDALVNCAAYDKPEWFLDSGEDSWSRIVETNLMGTIRCVHAAGSRMREGGGGAIVNVASDAGRVGSSLQAVYSATKGGIIALTKSTARELCRFGIRVNCVAPGPADTHLFDLIREDHPKVAQALERSIPMRRLATPGDIAPTVAFLCSDQAGYITGQTVSVNGGLTMI
jgi:2-hydroxycyclohexanecarboxyl-CoA dehydrogenase